MKLSEIDRNLAEKLWHQNGPASMGGDPEFFISTAKGKIMNADAFLPGKEKPLDVGAHGKLPSKLFFDGIQGEMAVAYSTCREFLVDNIRYCWDKLVTMLPPDHKIVLKPSARIQKAVIEGADPEARIFGCAPDFNAYTLSTNTPEMDATHHPYRYAGGHLHFGLWDIQYRSKKDPFMQMISNESDHLRIIKLFDLLVTIPTLLLDNGPDAIRRRSKYGRAGCFRPTPYGVEYRTPSCWWLKSPSTVSIVYGLARIAWTMVGMGLDGEFVKAVEVDEDTVSGCINESDTKTVKSIWSRMRPYLAVIGWPFTNPLNIGTVKTDKFDYVKDNYKGFNGAPQLKGRPVHCLAAFEYMLKNGLHSVVNPDVPNEWASGGVDGAYNGFANESFGKLLNNEDFQKFQKGFLKDFYK